MCSTLQIRFQKTFDKAIAPANCDFSPYSSYLDLVAVGQALSLLYGSKSPHSSNPHRRVGISSACPLRAGTAVTPSRLYRHLSGDRSECPDEAVLHSHSIHLSIHYPFVYPFSISADSGVHPCCFWMKVGLQPG